jgi:hypothetical protein
MPFVNRVTQSDSMDAVLASVRRAASGISTSLFGAAGARR